MYRWNKLLVLTTSELTQCEKERKSGWGEEVESERERA